MVCHSCLYIYATKKVDLYCIINVHVWGGGGGGGVTYCCVLIKLICNVITCGHTVCKLYVPYIVSMVKAHSNLNLRWPGKSRVRATV